jgi:hypothetical protein
MTGDMGFFVPLNKKRRHRLSSGQGSRGRNASTTRDVPGGSRFAGQSSCRLYSGNLTKRRKGSRTVPLGDRSPLDARVVRWVARRMKGLDAACLAIPTNLVATHRVVEAPVKGFVTCCLAVTGLKAR